MIGVLIQQLQDCLCLFAVRRDSIALRVCLALPVSHIEGDQKAVKILALQIHRIPDGAGPQHPGCKGQDGRRQ